MADRPQWGDDSGPDLRVILEKIKENRRFVFLGVGLVLLGLLAYGSFFQVEPEEEAIVLRFGKPTGQIYPPGLHFKIPYADQVHKVPVQRQLRIEFGFRSEPGKVTTSRTRGFETESLMLTGDLLLVHVRWSVIYRIDDIVTWLFRVRDQQDTIRDIAMAVMREVVGDYSLHEVLTTRVREIQAVAMQKTEKALKLKVPTGVRVTELAIKTTDPPDRAADAFDEFNRTEQKVRAMLSETKAAKEDAIGDAEQEQKNAIGQAERRRTEIVKNAQGEADAFRKQLLEFRKAPAITRQWMYLQTMQRVLSSVSEKLVLDEEGTGTLKLLPLNELLAPRRKQRVAPKTPKPAPGGIQ